MNLKEIIIFLLILVIKWCKSQLILAMMLFKVKVFKLLIN